MNSTHVFELRGEPDRYPGFVQVFIDEKEPWKEIIASRCLEYGAKPLGSSYTPVPLVFDNEGRKKNVVGDLSFRLAPFLILSEKARKALESFLSPAGEFLEIAAPVPGFVGYRVLKQIDGCIDMESSTYTRYDNGNVLVRKPVMYEPKVRGADIFWTRETASSVFISDAFKAAVDKAKLKGFDLSREVPLTG
jgi:hypothetical protein